MRINCAKISGGGLWFIPLFIMGALNAEALQSTLSNPTTLGEKENARAPSLIQNNRLPAFEQGPTIIPLQNGRWEIHLPEGMKEYKSEGRSYAHGDEIDHIPGPPDEAH